MNKMLSKIFLRYFNKKETFDGLIIRWADTIVLKSDHTGKLDTRSFIPDWAFSEMPTSQSDVNDWINSPDRAIRESVREKLGIKSPIELTNSLTPYFDAVQLHFLKNEYITNEDLLKKNWVLTDRGRIMKEIGGHKKYKTHRLREINVLKNQYKINILLIGATAAAAIMPFLAAWVFTTKVYNTNVLPAPVYRPEVRIDSVWLRKQVDDLIQKRLSSLKQVESTKEQPPKKATP